MTLRISVSLTFQCYVASLILSILPQPTCEEYFAMLRWAILQDKKPIAIRIPTNGVNHTKEAVDAAYGYEPKYKMVHRVQRLPSLLPALSIRRVRM